MITKAFARSILLCVVFCSISCFPDSVKQPNFVIILADDMGYGDSSAYGGWIETPQLERMAREGMRFTDFHSSGTVCSPTRAGLLTGRYQERAGLGRVIGANPSSFKYYLGLQDSETTFAELLKGAGYTSAILGKWHLGGEKKYNPIHHGFDRFRGFIGGNVDYISHYDLAEQPDWWDGLEQVEEEGYVTHLLTQHAVSFLEQNKNRPFLLYVSHAAMHSPIQAADDAAIRGPRKNPQKNARRTDEVAVKGMMRSLDENVGTILDNLKRLGLDERTLVFFFSDNGGAKHLRNDPLRGGKATLWEGGHRVPAIAWWPGKIKSGSVSDSLTISLDIMPTVLQVADVALPTGHAVDGRSLVPLLFEDWGKGEQQAEGRNWVEGFAARKLFWSGKAMREGPWKLIAMKGKEPLLYDLASDLSETTDLSSKYPERIESMLKAIEAWKEDVYSSPTPQPEADAWKEQHAT